MKKIKLLSIIMGAMLGVSVLFGGVKCVNAGERSIENSYVNVSSYEDTMKNVVEPYISTAKESGYLDVGQADFKIYYEKYKVLNAKGNIVISHGFTESLERYHEMIYYFMNEGYSVYGLEHRGHGRSGHLGKADETQVNVDSFEDYVSDLKSFLDNVVKPETQCQKLYLFGHSMGGGIGARFLEQYDGQYFDAAILSSPMMEINTGDIPENIAFLLSSASLPTSLADKYANGEAYKDEYNFAAAATSCEERYAYGHNVTSSNKEIQRGGASYRWLQTSLAATINMRTEAANVKVPVLLFQAENDSFVKPGGQETFRDAAANCTLVQVANAKHEIYLEKDEILKPYLEKVMNFYNAN